MQANDLVFRKDLGLLLFVDPPNSAKHGRRSVGGQGDMPPYFLKWRDALCFDPPPLLFWEQTLFVMHSTDCRRSDSAKTVTRIIG